MKEKRGKRGERLGPSDIVSAALALIFIYSFAVVFTLYFRPLYYACISMADLPQSVGMPMSEIVANYEALIWYNSIFERGPLDFPTLDLSASGRIHYEEVKRIFVAFQIAFIVSAGALMPLAIAKLYCGKARFLKIGGAASAILAAAVLVYLGLDWERFFVRFHEVLFDNDYWMFDADADPSILILPNGYFLACAVMIFALVFGLSAVSMFVARRIGRRPAGSPR